MKGTQPSFNVRILVVPLDWGLGHAARCIPLVKALLAAGCEVVLAGEGKTKALLQTEFPHLLFLPLAGYRITYSKTRMGTLRAVLQQVPKLLNSIKKEQIWLQKVITKYNINGVISDNRYGLYHDAVPTIFITHQLRIKTPFGRLGEAFLQKWNYRLLQKFTQVWVPDVEGEKNLAGNLAHPAVMPSLPVIYIGALTRFGAVRELLTHYTLVLLSGPEPQRTLLEAQVLRDAQLFKNPILLVRGLPGHNGLPTVPYHVTVVNHLSTNALQLAIEGATYVVSRTGYSSVMELLSLHKKCILIPTPGQPEQEYLAKHLSAANLALCIPQKKFSLQRAISLAETYPYQYGHFKNEEALKEAIDGLLTLIKNKRESL